MDLAKLVKSRYSVRAFSSRPVEPEVLEQILEIGNAAPTAKNQQPQRIYVVSDEKALKAMGELTPCLYGAGTVLVFTYNRDEEWENPFESGIRSGVQDVSIVATHIMLAAAERGIGTCWCDYFPNTRLEAALGIPKNEKSVLIMPIGYAAENSAPSDRHGKRKPLSDTVRYV